LTSKGLGQITLLTQLADISLVRCGGLKDGLQNLQSLPKLEHLHIEGSHIFNTTVTENDSNLSSLELMEVYGLSDEDMLCISLLSRLKSLILFNCCDITDTGLGRLSSLHLTKLMISGSNAAKQAIDSVTHLTTLKTLGLEDMDINDVSLQTISSLTQLQSLYLNSNRNITDNGLKWVSALPVLSFLSLANCQSIAQSTSQPLSLPSSLVALSLQDSLSITDRAVKNIVSSSNITFINLSGCYQVSDNVIQSIIEDYKKNGKELTMQRDYIYSIQRPSPLYNQHRNKIATTFSSRYKKYKLYDVTNFLFRNPSSLPKVSNNATSIVSDMVREKNSDGN
jgi:hypothetical protein